MSNKIMLLWAKKTVLTLKQFFLMCEDNKSIVFTYFHFVNQNLPLCLWRCCGFSNIDNFHFIRNRSCKCYRNHYHHNTDRNRESNNYKLGIQKKFSLMTIKVFFSLFKTLDAESFALRFGIVIITILSGISQIFSSGVLRNPFRVGGSRTAGR